MFMYMYCTCKQKVHVHVYVHALIFGRTFAIFLGAFVHGRKIKIYQVIFFSVDTANYSSLWYVNSHSTNC